MIRPSLRRGRGPAAPRSGKDDDTGPGYYDTPPATSGARAEPGSRARGNVSGGTSAPPAAAEPRDAQIALICTIAGLSELESNTVQNGGSRVSSAPRAVTKRDRPMGR